MAKSANQKIKILYLLQILWQRTDDQHGLTLEELSAALAEYGVEAERKTLYDDLETLQRFGLDIEKRRDKTVRYHLVSRLLELAELKLLVDAVQAGKWISRKRSNQLIGKLGQLASGQQARQLKRQVFVTNRLKSGNEAALYAVDAIHEAIQNDRQLSFQYFDYNAAKEKVLRHGGRPYRVSPWALTWEDENYYLIAYDGAAGMLKHFRVDKMVSVAPQEARREGADSFRDFDIGLYTQRTFGMFAGQEELVHLRCQEELAGVILDRFGHEVAFTNVRDGFFEVRVKVQVSPLFLSWLLNFAGKITVLGPDSVPDKLVELAQGVLSTYKP